MAYFEWGPDLVIDHGALDEDHQKLVALVNELHTATSQGQGHTVVAKVLSEVVIYTQEHLVREEALMEAIGFPGLVGHKQVHDRFMADMRDLQRKYASGSITVASQLSSKLRDWLSIHIRRSDKELIPYVKPKRPHRAGAA